MSIIIDLTIIAIVIISVILSAKKGFIASLIELVGYFAAIIISYTISMPLAKFINESFTNLSPIINQALAGLISVILVSVLFVVVKIISKAITKLFNLTIIGKINSFFGGVLGIAKGAIIAFAICLIITIIMYVKGEGFWIFNTETINSTYIFKRLMELSPFI